MSNNNNLSGDQGGSSTRMTRDELRQQIQNLSIQFNVAIITSMIEFEKFVLAENPIRELCGAGYVRYSTLLQRDGFSLDAQIRQILERAQAEGIKMALNGFQGATRIARRE